MPPKYPLNRLMLCVAVLWLAAALRLWNLGEQSVWFDEGWSAYAATLPTLTDAFGADATNPPLYYMLLWLWARVVGTSEFALRALSWAFGMLSVALVGRLAAHVAGARAGMLALWLAALSLPSVWAAQEMRMYTLLAALMLVLMAAGWRLADDWRDARAWAALWLAELALLYAHNSAPVVWVWLNVGAVGVWAWRYVGHWRLAGVWGLSQVLILALWMPYLFGRFLAVAGANSALIRRTPLSLELWAGLWLAPWELVPLLSAAQWASLGMLAALLAALTTARARGWALLAVVMLGGLWLALALLGNELHGRYWVMPLPLVWLALAVWASGRRETALGLAAWAALLFGLGVRMWAHPSAQPDDARAMVRHYAQTLRAEDSVIAWSYADRYELAYYWERLGVSARRVTLPEGATWQVVQPLLPQGGRVSLNVWYTQRADYRGMLGCALGHGTRTPPSAFTVNGMQTLTFENVVPPALTLQDARAVFTVGTLNAVGEIPHTFDAQQALCLPLALVLTQPTSAELKAALVAINAQGVEVAAVSSVFATADGRTSVDGTLGETLTAYPLLRLPAGTPPDSYMLRVRVFDDAALAGYDLLRDGAPAGKDWALGTWQVQRGARWLAEPPAQLTLDALTPLPPTVRNGQRLQVGFTWGLPPNAPLPAVTLAAADGAWSVDVPSGLAEHDDLVHEWRTVQIPLDAPAGEAVLRVAGLGAVGRVQVEPLPLLSAPPAFEVAVLEGASFPEVGRVVGYSVGATTPADLLPVTLIWQADEGAPPAQDYTVFVQLLNADGTLHAQSDAPPSAGERPTGGWRAGEYIEDTHLLRRVDSSAIFNGGTLIVGLYDASGRLRTSNGDDFVRLGVLSR